MRKSIVVLLTVFITILINCSSSTEPEAFDFTEMDILYKETEGGRILAIDGEGIIQAYLVNMYNDTLKNTISVLSEQDKQEFSKLFRYFPLFDREYNNRSIRTFGAFYIVFTYEGVADTVSVGNSPFTVIPTKLNTIWEGLKGILSEMGF